MFGACTQFFVGLDLGQSQDYTALAILERLESKGEWDAGRMAHRKNISLRLRHLERVPLGTPYPEIVERVRNVVRSDALAGRCSLVVDATGVGRPVIDLLRRAELGCPVRAVVVTGGIRERLESGWAHVPKRDLILRVQLLLQQHRLQIAARLPFGEALTKEMGDMRVKFSAAGNEQFGAWREGTHDDLVFAVALSCWGCEKLAGTEGGHWGPNRPLWEMLV